MNPHNSRDLFRLPRQVAIVILVFMVITTCNMPGMLLGKQGSSADGPLATSEQPIQGSGSAEASAVLGFVLDPDGAPVAYASVAGEIADSNGAVSGDLTGSASGWLEVNALGHATGYKKPGEGIGKTAIFEARLTPFEVFLPLESGEEVVFTLGDVAQPVAEVSIPAGAVSSLPAYVEAAVYDLVDVGPYPAELDSGEALDLKLAIAVEATSDQLEPVSLASGKTLTLKLFPNPSLPENPVMAIFDAEKGVWEVQADACMPGEAGALLCAIPRFSPLIGFFGPSDEVGQRLGLVKHLLIQAPTDDDQAYQDAMTDVEVWAYIGQGQVERTGEVSAEWSAEMANRLGKLADAAEAYAATHPDTSGISHLLVAAELAIGFGDQPTADKLIQQAKATAESMADELLKESDCGRMQEMAKMYDLLTSLGSPKAAAMLQKMQSIGDCDIWAGTIYVWFVVSSSPPGGLDWALESGGGNWMETHKVTMTTNVQTHVLKGEDTVKLDFGQVMYGEKNRHGCHDYLTHGLEGGGGITLNFDGQYDGYTFTVGDLQTTGGSASITYGAHGERWDSEEEKCVEIRDATVPAPNYTSVLRHGFSGSPPITMQEMLQGGDNTHIRGQEEISNDAFELGIIPVESGHVIWGFYHVKKGLPQK